MGYVSQSRKIGGCPRNLQPQPQPRPPAPPEPPGTCAVKFPGWVNCDDYEYPSQPAAVHGEFPGGNVTVGPGKKAKKCGTGGGTHWMVFVGKKCRKAIASIICCKCCVDTPKGPVTKVGCNVQ